MVGFSRFGRYSKQQYSAIVVVVVVVVVEEVAVVECSKVGSTQCQQ